VIVFGVGVVFKNLRVSLTWSLSVFDFVHYRLISVFFLRVVCVCQVFGEPFHEYTHAEEGEAVMGKEYVGKIDLLKFHLFTCQYQLLPTTPALYLVACQTCYIPRSVYYNTTVRFFSAIFA